MTKYRYARSNGQFLPSKFINSVAQATTQDFKANQAYDLVTAQFVSGTNPLQNSLVLEANTGYNSKDGLLAWWSLNTDISSAGTVADKTTGDRYLDASAYTAGLSRPSFASGVTPSSYIQDNSNYFEADKSALYVVTGSSSDDSLSFVNADNTDAPFSISVWVKPDFDSTDWFYIFDKSAYFGGASLISYSLKCLHNISTGLTDVRFALYDPSGWPSVATNYTGIQKEDISINGSWTHIVFTYDGRGGNGAGGERDGMKLYINGSDSGAVDYYNGDYLSTGRNEYPVGVGAAGKNAWYVDGNQDFQGNIAEVAVWRKELTATDAAHLYGVSTAGAYRLVRDFSIVSPDNDTRVLGIATEKKGFNVSGFPPDIMDTFLQGINVVSLKQLTDYTSFKLRPNSSFITTLRGKDVSRTAFDETLSVTTFPSGSAHVVFGGDGKLSERLTHEREIRDLGQTSVYDSLDGEPYVDTSDLNAVAIVTKHPLALVLPSQMVTQTGDEAMDGVIEPFALRETIDGSSTEAPFYARSVKASLGGITDASNRTYVLVDGWDLDEPIAGAAPFLDSTETFGTIDLPGAFSTTIASIEPYVDYLNDIDKEYTTNNVSTAISDVMIQSSSFDDDDIRTFDKMAPHGFIFDNDPIGIDSIAYGGLKK